MAPNPRRIDSRLAELYELVPEMKDCKGKCADSCGPIEMSVRERQKLERESGRKVTADACGKCSMLTPMGRCSQYELRPMICRLFGTTKGLRCAHGCEPVRWLDDNEGAMLLGESLKVGGEPAGWGPVQLALLQETLRQIEFGDVVRGLRLTGRLPT